ncbi:hypothetical protein ACET3Z_015604 [Daucus carota]
MQVNKSKGAVSKSIRSFWNGRIRTRVGNRKTSNHPKTQTKTTTIGNSISCFIGIHKTPLLVLPLSSSLRFLLTVLHGGTPSI